MHKTKVKVVARPPAWRSDTQMYVWHATSMYSETTADGLPGAASQPRQVKASLRLARITAELLALNPNWPTTLDHALEGAASARDKVEAP